MKNYLLRRMGQLLIGIQNYFQPTSTLIFLSFIIGTYFTSAKAVTLILILGIIFIRKSKILILLLFFTIGVMYTGIFYKTKVDPSQVSSSETKNYIQKAITKNSSTEVANLINSLIFRERNRDSALSGIKASGINFIVINSLILSLNKYINKKILLIFSIFIVFFYFYLIGFDEVVIFKATLLLLFENLALLLGRLIDTRVSITFTLLAVSLTYPLVLTESFAQFSFLMTILIYFIIRALPKIPLKLYLSINLSFIICLVFLGSDIKSDYLILSTLLLFISPLLLISSLLFILSAILKITIITNWLGEILSFVINKINSFHSQLPSIIVPKGALFLLLLLLIITLIYKDYEGFKTKKYII